MPMKTKIICGLLAALLLIFAIVACNRHSWSEQQRHEAREMVGEWREAIYLNDLSEAEYALFAGRVADILEMKYPSYVEFVEMPLVGDSVEMVIITAITSELKATPERLRHIFRYDDLVELGTLPTGLTRHQQNIFYRCLAEQINQNYGSMQSFVWDAIYSQLDDVLITQLLRHCAWPFWDVEMDITIINE